MDSVTDVPIILTEEFAKAQAYATMEGIAKIAGLKKKQTEPNEPEKVPEPERWFVVQSNPLDKETAENLLQLQMDMKLNPTLLEVVM